MSREGMPEIVKAHGRVIATGYDSLRELTKNLFDPARHQWSPVSGHEEGVAKGKSA
jgi:hypothetical protein